MVFSNTFSISLLISSLLFGVGLSMDAFSISVVSGFEDPKMPKKRAILIISAFALFQALMPMLGWTIIHFTAQSIAWINYVIPYIALILLSYIGIKMIFEYKRETQVINSGEQEAIKEVKGKNISFLLTLLIQAIATSIDALSVGFDTYEYNVFEALISSLIIAAMTFIICSLGIVVGKKSGEKIGVKATLVGAIILLVLGVFIFTKGMIKLYVREETLESLPYLIKLFL